MYVRTPVLQHGKYLTFTDSSPSCTNFSGKLFLCLHLKFVTKMEQGFLFEKHGSGSVWKAPPRRESICFRIARQPRTIVRSHFQLQRLLLRPTQFPFGRAHICPRGRLEPWHNHVNVLDGASGPNLRFPPVSP